MESAEFATMPHDTDVMEKAMIFVVYPVYVRQTKAEYFRKIPRVLRKQGELRYRSSPCTHQERVFWKFHKYRHTAFSLFEFRNIRLYERATPPEEET
jgi:hypothetical protein